MKGLVFTGNRTVALQQFPDPTPGPGEVVLQMKASGMCGSDLKFYRPAPGKHNAPSDWATPNPRLPDTNPAAWWWRWGRT